MVKIVVYEGTLAEVTEAMATLNSGQGPSKARQPTEPIVLCSGTRKRAVQCLAVLDDGRRCSWRASAPLKTQATPFTADGLCQFHAHWSTRRHPPRSHAMVLPRDWA